MLNWLETFLDSCRDFMLINGKFLRIIKTRDKHFQLIQTPTFSCVNEKWNTYYQNWHNCFLCLSNWFHVKKSVHTQNYVYNSDNEIPSDKVWVLRPFFFILLLFLYAPATSTLWCGRNLICQTKIKFDF